ncbi:hypothetical protein KP509_17G018200 [Ceratopteris richardii]|uniref:Core Histone H2A/H2B/H3 domain-containing protein n=1 Tax=Ceratopteris richardii TaxID=49495 RepID=A0A8T2SXB3_CERRI|nr:hypothetical protein KP509_17G018200 [Ceratopteris richardii]
MARRKKTTRKLYPQDQEKNFQNQDDKGPSPHTNSQSPDTSEKSTKKRVCYQVKSLREIRRAQKSVGLLIPRLPFMRVVKKISVNLSLLCLQEATEDFAIDFMNDAYLCAAHCHRVTLMSKDYVIVSRLRYKGIYA